MTTDSGGRRGGTAQSHPHRSRDLHPVHDLRLRLPRGHYLQGTTVERTPGGPVSRRVLVLRIVRTGVSAEAITVVFPENMLNPQTSVRDLLGRDAD